SHHAQFIVSGQHFKMRPTAQELQDPLVEPLTVAGLARVEKRTVHHFRETDRSRKILFRELTPRVGEPRIREFHVLPNVPLTCVQLDQFRHVPIRYPSGEFLFSGVSTTQHAEMFGVSEQLFMYPVLEFPKGHRPDGTPIDLVVEFGENQAEQGVVDPFYDGRKEVFPEIFPDPFRAESRFLNDCGNDFIPDIIGKIPTDDIDDEFCHVHRISSLPYWPLTDHHTTAPLPVPQHNEQGTISGLPGHPPIKAGARGPRSTRTACRP